MHLLRAIGLRRPTPWDTPTWLDEILDSPLQAVVIRLYLIILWIRGRPIRPPKGKSPIRVVCLSDTHEEIVGHVPDGDLLIHAGDMVTDGTALSIQKQIDWLASLPHRHKYIVTGNHDSWFDHSSRTEEDALGHQSVDLKGIEVLNNESRTVHFKEGRRVVIYGAPDVPRCGGSDNAFQYDRAKHPWSERIPLDTEILVTHTPPRHHLDLDLGCEGLLEETWRVRPTLHVFGHVHCGRGTQAVYWDDCQKALEDLQSRRSFFIDLLPRMIVDLLPRGIIDLVPSYRWVDAFSVVYYGFLGVIWQFLWQGGYSGGSLMVNAGCQDGNKGRLTKKKPFVIEI